MGSQALRRVTDQPHTVVIGPLPCFRCERPADSIHVLPGLIEPPKVVRFGCRRHDPGGYWFHVRRWFTGPSDHRNESRIYTMRRHLLDTKIHGAEAVALIDAALIVARETAA